MLYFDHMHQDHFGTIKQQIWASLYLPLHTMLVLILQGVSYLIMWLVALMRMNKVDARFRSVQAMNGTFTNGTAYASELRRQISTYLWNTISKGVDASKALDTWNSSLVILAQNFDSVRLDGNNQTACDLMGKSLGTAESMAIQTMFDSLAISVPKDGSKKDVGVKGTGFDKYDWLQRYENRFELVFDYVFLYVSFDSLLVLFLSSSHSHTHLTLALLPSYASQHQTGRPHPDLHGHHHLCLPSAQRMQLARVHPAVLPHLLQLRYLSDLPDQHEQAQPEVIHGECLGTAHDLLDLLLVRGYEACAVEGLRISCSFGVRVGRW
jgi:hypothetical protein